MKKQIKKENKAVKIKKIIKACPLVTALILSAAIISIIGIIGMAAGKYEFKISMSHPSLAAVLAGEYKNKEEDALPPEDILTQQENASSSTGTSIANGADVVFTPAQQEAGSPTQYAPRNPAPPRSAYYDDPQVTALTTEYNYVPTDEAYFHDALFIGDSRAEGMCFYSKLEGAEYCYKEGLRAANMLTEEISTKSSPGKTVIEVLNSRQFKRIYIMLGINDLGYGTPDKFAAKYAENLNTIRSLQPDSVIIILGIMNVTTKYSNSQDVFNNDNINSRNVAISRLADGLKVFYFDLNPSLIDENGGICEGYTWDGIHLKAEYYSLCDEFLKARGIP